eukprot:GHVR01132023.1.p1 GENE.GHVR01132023.1~~GHVR01132023.1.p1  ORF type:complete len:720 (+),score=117.25 GHVR01132023.1:36-2195(+)
MSLVTLATCNLNQWALDFDKNLENVCKSISISKARGASIRLGSELELCGYGCEDHFHEVDTFTHCWESLDKILLSDLTVDMLVCIGMPVMHKTVPYNCIVFCLNKNILLIRPKMMMAQSGNYREMRYFASWNKGPVLEDCVVPLTTSSIINTIIVPFGYGVVQCLDTVVGAEICEELWTPDSPHIDMGLDGVEIFVNASGSHHQLRKLKTRLSLVQLCTSKAGGIYMYGNQRGCDGSRLYFDGSALIAMNGNIHVLGSQFGTDDVEVITATLDLQEVRSYRSSIPSRCAQGGSLKHSIPTVMANIRVTNNNIIWTTQPIEPVLCTPMEEISRGPSMWMWDYLRRSGASGFFLPLSGGADSACVAAIIGSMCNILCHSLNNGSEQVLADLCSVLKCTSDSVPREPKQLANALLHTAYISTTNSSEHTKKLSKGISDEIGTYHLEACIDTAVSAVVGVFSIVTGVTPNFTSKGGTYEQDVSLQNIQARLRMVVSYLFGSLLPYVRGGKGYLLVVGAGNVDECLRGYLTKYDCSSGDINPIGSISKVDLRSFCVWAADNLGYKTLINIAQSVPSAELRPLDGSPIRGGKDTKGILFSEEGQVIQDDEAEMGMTYDELSYFGRLRKIDRLGPVSMFRNLVCVWRHISPREVAMKVKHFFVSYGKNRHKMSTITPSYHADSYSPDDNRYDHRQIIYPISFTRQFSKIDELTQMVERRCSRLATG